MSPEQSNDIRVADAAPTSTASAARCTTSHGPANVPGETVLQKIMAQREHRSPSFAISRRRSEALEKVFQKMMAKRPHDVPLDGHMISEIQKCNATAGRSGTTAPGPTCSTRRTVGRQA